MSFNDLLESLEEAIASPSTNDEPENTVHIPIQAKLRPSRLVPTQTPASISQTSEMAQTNYQLLRMYIDAIRPFDGNVFALNDFVTACDALESSYAKPNDTPDNINLNNFLLQSIKSKLHGQALTIIGCRFDLNSWADIRKTLVNHFSDPRSIANLEHDLRQTARRNNESLHDFGLRLQNLQSLLLAKVSQSNDAAIEKTTYIKIYQKLTLDTYTHCLPQNYQIMIRLSPFTTLEEAINLVTQEEQFNKTARQTSSQNFSQTHPYTNQNYNKPQFPSQPITLPPRRITQPNFPTNQQVFGRQNVTQNQNVFKPRTQNTQSFKPTPMSGVSVQPRQNYAQNPSTSRQNFTPQFQPKTNSQIKQQFPWFKQSIPQKFMTQELHTVELDPTVDYIHYPEESTEILNPRFADLNISETNELTPEELEEFQNQNEEYNENINFPNEPRNNQPSN